MGRLFESFNAVFVGSGSSWRQIKPQLVLFLNQIFIFCTYQTILKVFYHWELEFFSYLGRFLCLITLYQDHTTDNSQYQVLQWHPLCQVSKGFLKIKFNENFKIVHSIFIFWFLYLFYFLFPFYPFLPLQHPVTRHVFIHSPRLFSFPMHLFLNPLSISPFFCLNLNTSTLCFLTTFPCVLPRIKVHFAAGEPVGRVRLAEPSPDLVILPAECQRALGQRAVWTTPPGPLWAPVWPRDRWAKRTQQKQVKDLHWIEIFVIEASLNIVDKNMFSIWEMHCITEKMAFTVYKTELPMQ